MLSLVEECVERIATRAGGGQPPDLSRIDFADQAVYDRICRGDTVGLFQIESRAQIQMIRRTRPKNLEDLAVEVAIVRPGPIVGGAVNPYVRRREDERRARARGRRYEPPVDHPLLRDVLAETLGVILYQDQVLQVCQALAGFTPGQAEALRRAMSRRRSRELMAGFWEEFRDGAAARGVPEHVAERVFTQVIAFSEFGFPKSHAAAFGLLAYQSAWLRHYYAAEYYCALFNNQPMGFYSLDALGRDAQRHGIEIRLPDVNKSDVWCDVEGAAVRVGLGFIRDWSEETASAVVTERARGGPFRGIGDFVRRAAAHRGAERRAAAARARHVYRGRGIGGGAPAPRDRERIHLRAAGRRSGHGERDRAARRIPEAPHGDPRRAAAVGTRQAREGRRDGERAGGSSTKPAPEARLKPRLGICR